MTGRHFDGRETGRNQRPPVVKLRKNLRNFGLGAIDRLMRERVGLAPAPVPVPLHRMAAARQAAATRRGQRP